MIWLPLIWVKNRFTGSDESNLRSFTRAVLKDLHALVKMLATGAMEADAGRIGAEQEIFLINSSMHPAPFAVEVIEAAIFLSAPNGTIYRRCSAIRNIADDPAI